MTLGERIRARRRARGWTLKELGARCRPALTYQQIHRIETGKVNILHEWLVALAAAFDLPLSDLSDDAPGLAESEARAFEASEGDTAARIMRQFYPEGAHAFPMRVTGPALDLAGLIADDWIVVDPGIEPREGDRVVAQVYDDEAGTARTVLRMLSGGFLVPRSSRADFDTLAADDERVRMAGVIVRWYGERREPGTSAA